MFYGDSFFFNRHPDVRPGDFHRIEADFQRLFLQIEFERLHIDSGVCGDGLFDGVCVFRRHSRNFEHMLAEVLAAASVGERGDCGKGDKKKNLFHVRIGYWKVVGSISGPKGERSLRCLMTGGSFSRT